MVSDRNAPGFLDELRELLTNYNAALFVVLDKSNELSIQLNLYGENVSNPERYALGFYLSDNVFPDIATLKEIVD